MDTGGVLPGKGQAKRWPARRGAIYRAQGWGGADTTEFANSIRMDGEPGSAHSTTGSPSSPCFYCSFPLFSLSHVSL